MPFIGRFISSPSSLRGHCFVSQHLYKEWASAFTYTVYLNRERNVAFGVGQALLSCAKFIYEVAWNDLKRLVSGTRLAQVTWRLVLDYRSNVVAIWTFRPYLTVSRYSLHSNFFVFSAVRSVRARVCSPLQTWLAATAEKALSEWKVILWHCDIGCFFLVGLSVWKVFFLRGKWGMLKALQRHHSVQPNKHNPLYMLYTEPTQSCTNAQLITKAHKHVPVGHRRKPEDSLITGIGSHERHEHVKLTS